MTSQTTGPVIVGVDGSDTALRAAERARDLAAALQVPLLVVTAHSEERTQTVVVGSDEYRVSESGTAHDVAEQVARRLRRDDVEIRPSAARGRPSEALAALAESEGAQMIVVGNQRMRGMARVLGSVASSVAHNAQCDVHIVNTYT
ncbi:MAG: universal stress protein [Nesterenkonia sp.]|nr:universal stress protein [Nesterenkonia sp.]